MIIYILENFQLVIGAHVFHCACAILDTPLIRATAHEISSDFAKISMRFLRFLRDFEISYSISRFTQRFLYVFRDFQSFPRFLQRFPRFPDEVYEISQSGRPLGSLLVSRGHTFRGKDV